MKILFLATWYPYPPDNGSKLRVYHLLRALAQAHHVRFISFAFGTAQPEQATALRALCADIATAVMDPFAVNRAGAVRTFLSPRPMATRPISAMRQLVEHTTCQQPFDVVIASTEMMANYALMLPDTTLRVLEEHNSLTRWMWERYTQQSSTLQKVRCWVSWQKQQRFERRLFPQFALVTMVSEQDRQFCAANLSAHDSRLEVIPNGVDCNYNRPGLADPVLNRLVYNGALNYNANYEAMRWFLAEIYPQIKLHVPDVTLTITGSTAGVDVNGLALDGSVTLTGYVEDVRTPVAAAAVCVAPIRQGGGTRLKILEAMAMGTPVVATRKAAEGLDVTENEHLLLADSAAQFAAATIMLLHNTDLRRYLAGNARRLVEARYDWRTIGARFVELIEETVERSRRTSE